MRRLKFREGKWLVQVSQTKKIWTWDIWFLHLLLFLLWHGETNLSTLCTAALGMMLPGCMSGGQVTGDQGHVGQEGSIDQGPISGLPSLYTSGRQRKPYNAYMLLEAWVSSSPYPLPHQTLGLTFPSSKMQALSGNGNQQQNLISLQKSSLWETLHHDLFHRKTHKLCPQSLPAQTSSTEALYLIPFSS